ncbi:putative Phage tail protein [Pseudomonas chlororaphis]|uniref:hypothetical protein n=1 Tax=Pseudomonas chlororaphis TaxID=587753 RepID=UPI0039E0E4CD
MPVFGLVSEGVTDQAVLENLLNGYYLDSLEDELDFVHAQPVSGQGKQRGRGGWEELFKFLACDELVSDIFLNSDFVVIHIDSDCAGHVNFGVKLHDISGVMRPASDIVSDIKGVIISKISADVYAAFSNKILFAITVHSMECWVLPLFGKKRSRANEVSCERKLAHELRNAGCENYLIKREDKIIKEYPVYLEVSKGFYDQRNSAKMASHNESLEMFILSLPAL